MINYPFSIKTYKTKNKQKDRLQSINNLNIFPKDIQNIIISYDYILYGERNTVIEKDDPNYFSIMNNGKFIVTAFSSKFITLLNINTLEEHSITSKELLPDNIDELPKIIILNDSKILVYYVDSAYLFDITKNIIILKLPPFLEFDTLDIKILFEDSNEIQLLIRTQRILHIFSNIHEPYMIETHDNIEMLNILSDNRFITVSTDSNEIIHIKLWQYLPNNSEKLSYIKYSFNDDKDFKELVGSTISPFGIIISVRFGEDMGNLIFFDYDTIKILKELPLENYLSNIVYIGNNKIMGISHENNIEVISFEGRKENIGPLKFMYGDDLIIHIFLPDTRLAIISDTEYDTHMIIYDPYSGIKNNILLKDDSNIINLTLLDNGNIAIANDTMIEIYD